MPKKTKQIIPAKRTLETDKDYQILLDELKSIIAKGQYQAYKSVDNIKVQNSWGVRVLRSEIKSQLYENTSKPEIEETFKTKLPAIEPYEAFKDAYNFNFLGLDELYKEKELEDKIILHLEEKIFVARYKVKLPSEAKIKKALKNL